jgi:hypothetical protein
MSLICGAKRIGAKCVTAACGGRKRTLWGNVTDWYTFMCLQRLWRAKMRGKKRKILFFVWLLCFCVVGNESWKKRRRGLIAAVFSSLPYIFLAWSQSWHCSPIHSSSFSPFSVCVKQPWVVSLFAWKGSFFPHRTFHPRSNLLLKFVLYFSL